MCPPLEDSSPRLTAVADEFSPEERSLLLRLAHESVAAALEHSEISARSPQPHIWRNLAASSPLCITAESCEAASALCSRRVRSIAQWQKARVALLLTTRAFRR